MASVVTMRVERSYDSYDENEQLVRYASANSVQTSGGKHCMKWNTTTAV